MQTKPNGKVMHKNVQKILILFFFFSFRFNGVEIVANSEYIFVEGTTKWTPSGFLVAVLSISGLSNFTTPAAQIDPPVNAVLAPILQANTTTGESSAWILGIIIPCGIVLILAPCWIILCVSDTKIYLLNPELMLLFGMKFTLYSWMSVKVKLILIYIHWQQLIKLFSLHFTQCVLCGCCVRLRRRYSRRRSYNVQYTTRNGLF